MGEYRIYSTEKPNFGLWARPPRPWTRLFPNGCPKPATAVEVLGGDPRSAILCRFVPEGGPVIASARFSTRMAVPGSVRGPDCRGCKEPVWLSPSSFPLRDKHPDLAAVCFDCLDRALAD